MGWSSIVELGNWVETITSGEPIRTISWKTVYADKRDVRQSEFYSSRNSGLKPELMFIVRSLEFANHEKLRYGGKTYDITRTYDKGEYTELVVSATVGGGV